MLRQLRYYNLLAVSESALHQRLPRMSLLQIMKRFCLASGLNLVRREDRDDEGDDRVRRDRVHDELHAHPRPPRAIRNWHSGVSYQAKSPVRLV